MIDTFLITRKFTFDAGHRVLGHESKCANIHGHTYTAEVSLMSKKLDALGRVVDFSVIKSVVGAWIDLFWDHNYICHTDDPLYSLYRNTRDAHKGRIGIGIPKVEDPTEMRPLGWIDDPFPKKAPYVMVHGNPTAENMARELFEVCVNLFINTPQFKVHGIRLHETPNCFVDWIPGGGPGCFHELRSVTHGMEAKSDVINLPND